MERFQKKLWLWLAILAFLSPIGIILPRLFRAEEAWGEWGTETLAGLIGYVPQRLQKTAELWTAPLPDYTAGSLLGAAFGETGCYVASAIMGGFLVALFSYTIGKLCVNRDK